jgi:hypothetical protein
MSLSAAVLASCSALGFRLSFEFPGRVVGRAMAPVPKGMEVDRLHAGIEACRLWPADSKAEGSSEVVVKLPA